jgi:hypothetical protein
MIFYLGVIKLQNIMKIKLDNLDTENFMSHEHILNGEVVTLIQPKNIGAKWKKDNLHFRSSVWNYNGELISASFPKFFNWGEQPDLSPVPNSLKNATVVEKLDGSTLIVSKYNGQYILRTRGTVDASKLANGFELELFKSTILNKLQDNNDTWGYSIIWEWLSPINKIVLSYGDEPMWKLIGFIDHTDYSLATQDMLDAMAKKYDLLRPEIYTFTDISDMLQIVDKWQDKEGVCLYSKNGQTIHKIKAAKYLLLHHLKSELSSLEKVLDVWLEQGMPDYQTFYNYIFTTFDFELAEQIKGTISRIVDGKKEVNKIVDGMNNFVNNRLRSLPSRKEQAQLVISSYGETNRAAFVFKLLDGKSLGKDEYKKLLFQVLKN